MDFSIELCPKKCFISHSYKDENARDFLVKELQTFGKIPFIFPPIKIAPNQLVTNNLIVKILENECIIYLKGGYSDKSFWVAFERDYALRAGKYVCSFNISSLIITRDVSSPLDLPIYPSFSTKSSKRMEDLIKYMKKERFFDLYLFGPDWRDNFIKAVQKGIQSRVFDRNGYLVVFWTEDYVKSEYVRDEILWVQSKKPNHILYVLVDKMEVPILDDIKPISPDMVIKLYGDDTLSEINRRDNLIVMLYWLMYKNTFQNELF